MFAAPHASTTMSPANCSVSPSRSTVDAGDCGSGVVRLQADRLRVRQQRDVRVLERRPNPEHLGVRLPVHRAGEAVAVLAADAGAVRHVRLVEPDSARRVERAVAGGLEIVGELLDPGLVGDGRERVRRARRPLGRILAAGTVHLVRLLGPRVVGLELVVADRPGGRDPVVMAKLAEVLRPQPVQRGAVQLRRAADEVVHLRLERRRPSRRTTCRATRTCCRRTRPARASSRAHAAASRRARAAGSACRTGRGGGRACRRPRRSRR